MVELSGCEDDFTTEGAGARLVLLALLHIPLQGATVMNDMSVVAAVHGGGGGGLVDPLVADATA